MEYKEIISITGMSGLYQLVTTKSDGIIIRTLDEGKTRFVSARLHNFTPLESIEVFTTAENVPLSDVFKALKEHGNEEEIASLKSNDDVKKYFQKVFPQIDEDRVYVSDMKKMLKWFPILKKHDLLNFDTEDTEEKEEENKEEVDS